jgi:hypothetical protein
MHLPYHHSDLFAFLKAIKTKYSPDRIVCIGDEVDYHAISFHHHDPDLFSPADELKSAIQYLKYVIDSNHGSLVYRKAKAVGLPRNVFKSYNAILEAPKKWKWHNDLTLTMSDGNKVYFHHGKSSAVGKLSKNMSMSAVQGHFHSRFEIFYWANPNGLFFDMRVGCLINDRSMAFHYNKTTMDRPIIGCGIILDGHPKLLPMVMDKKGRWNQKV